MATTNKEILPKTTQEESNDKVTSPANSLPNLTTQELSIFQLATTAIKQKFKQILEIVTPTSYIKLKDVYEYVDDRYVDSVFNEYFPVSAQKIIKSGEFQNYFVYFDIEITAYITPNISITKIGTGGARIQIKSEAKKENIENGKPISPFDYVDFANNRKAAQTSAIKNAQHRFGIAGDMTNRIILSDEDLLKIEDAYKELMSDMIDQREKNKWKEKWLKAKNSKDKLKIINNLREQL